MRIKYAHLRKASTNAVTGNIRRSAYTCIAILYIVGIAFVVARVRVITGVVRIRWEGTLSGIGRGIDLNCSLLRFATQSGTRKRIRTKAVTIAETTFFPRSPTNA